MKEIEDMVADLVPFKSKDHGIEVNSYVACEFHKIFRKWLQDTDEHIRKNLSTLTCDNIREIYFALWGELKYWQSSSSGFTGFSETLLFRTLYHTIGEEFIQRCTGDCRDLIKFVSKNYEIGQNIEMKIDCETKCPDIYVKRNDQLISIIQVKTGVDKIEGEVETFELFKSKFPTIRGLFVVLTKSAFTPIKVEKLKKAGYETLILQNNNELIAKVLRRFI